MAVRCGAEIENGRCARARRGLSAATSDGGDGRSWWVGPTSTRLCALGVHTHLDTSRAARAQDARERVLLSQTTEFLWSSDDVLHAPAVGSSKHVASSRSVDVGRADFNCYAVSPAAEKVVNMCGPALCIFYPPSSASTAAIANSNVPLSL